MKYIRVLFQIGLALIIAVISFACSSSSDKTSKDEFFEPIDKRIVHKTNEPGTSSQLLLRERYSAREDDSMKDAIVEMLRTQNKKLDDVMQQLNTITNKDVADNSKNSENLENILSSRDRVSNEMLLEMIRDQNQRLNDVIEQLKVISQNQQNQRGVHSNLVARVNVAPIEQPKSHIVPAQKRLDASLSYGKAVELYQNRQYDKAISVFRSLINHGIASNLVDNCYFWMGVCYFNQRMGNQAISSFTDVLSCSNSDKAEGAYFMIGQCYEQMGAKKFAVMTFEKMLKEYPRGSLRQVTEKKLALLK